MAPSRRFTRSNRPLLKDVQAVELSVVATLSRLFTTSQNQKEEALGVVAQGAAVARLVPDLEKWPRNRRGKMASYVLEAFGVCDDAWATWGLDGLMRRFASEYRQFFGESPKQTLGYRAE